MGVKGFFKGLGKAALGVGAGIAAPLTGGASLMSIPAILGGVGGAASAISGGRAAGRQQEGNANFQHDQMALQGARLNLDAPRMRLGNSIQGDIAANAQDAHVSGPITHTHGQMPTISGGLRPSLMSGNTRQLGGQVSRDALLSQMNGPAFTPTPQPQANGLDTFLNGLGYAGLIGKGVSEFGKPKPKSSGTPPFISPISSNVTLPRF